MNQTEVRRSGWPHHKSAPKLLQCRDLAALCSGGSASLCQDLVERHQLPFRIFRRVALRPVRVRRWFQVDFPGDEESGDFAGLFRVTSRRSQLAGSRQGFGGPSLKVAHHPKIQTSRPDLWVWARGQVCPLSLFINPLSVEKHLSVCQDETPV